MFRSIAMASKFLVILFVITVEYAFITEGIGIIVRLIKYLTVAKYNYYTTKFQKYVEKRKIVPYKTKIVEIGDIIDISDIVKTIPKLIISIDVMTGKIVKKEVWRKSGICKAFIGLSDRGMIKCTKIDAKKKQVKKGFIYAQALINTLNLRYFNWQDLNPELINALKDEIIVAEEVVIPYLQNFQS